MLYPQSIVSILKIDDYDEKTLFLDDNHPYILIFNAILCDGRLASAFWEKNGRKYVQIRCYGKNGGV